VKTSLQDRHEGAGSGPAPAEETTRHKVFLLSPAHCGGKRAALIARPEAAFDLARRMRSPEGAPLGEVFAFLSGLYFRGKLAYANAFADPPPGVPGALVITAGRGLLEPSAAVGSDDLELFARTPVDVREPRYRKPLESAARGLADALPGGARVVLLGSISTPKYLQLLSGIFGERLHFPCSFVGMGDMQRGSVMLKAVEAGVELEYVAAAGAVRSRQKTLSATASSNAAPTG
jgi:hypothetical protein